MATPSAPVLRGRPRRADAERALLDAGREQLLAGGYAGLNLDRVAASAGVGKATAYRRFRNKADLATAVLADATGPLPEPTGHLRDDLVAHLLHVERTLGGRGLSVMAGVLAEEVDDPELIGLHRRRIILPHATHARALMEAAVERGELRDDPDALRSAREMIVGALFTRSLGGDRRARRRWATSVVDVALGGVAVRPPARRAPRRAKAVAR